MATITPPYADPGRAAFEELDTYVQNYLLAGSHPELAPAYSFPLANSTSFLQFAVVGLDANGKIAMATKGQAAAAASIALTFSGTGTADDTVTIGGIIYKLVAAPADPYDVDIGADAAGTAANLAAAINGGAGEGTVYGTDTPAHPFVSASVAGAVVTISAKQVGDGGNGITVSESGTGASFAGGATALSGGRDANAGGIQAIGVLAQAASLGASGSANGAVWYSGCFNQDALVWDVSFDSDAAKQAAFRGAPTPTNIIVAKRG